MGTKVIVEIEVGLDVSAKALESWIRDSLNLDIKDDPDASEELLDMLSSLEEYEGTVSVIPFEPTSKGDNNELTYTSAIELWGSGFQLDMVVEECAELIQAACKVKRRRDPIHAQAVIEEAADVTVMLEQLPYILSSARVVSGNAEGVRQSIEAVAATNRQRLERLVEAAKKAPRS